MQQPPKTSPSLPTVRRRWWLAGVVALVLAAVVGFFVLRSPPSQAARVVAVADGDTATALVAGERVKIRLWGIDAPESSQEHGGEAKAALAELVMGREVEIDDRGDDKYGRRLAVLRVAGESVNTRMVQLGWAWWYQRYAPRDRELRAAEEAARQGKVGLWAEAAPVAPWVFRHRGRP